MYLFIYIYVSYICPNGLTFFERTIKYPRVKYRLNKLDFFFSKIDFFLQKSYFFQNWIFKKFHGQRRALQLVFNILTEHYLFVFIYPRAWNELFIKLGLINKPWPYIVVQSFPENINLKHDFLSSLIHAALFHEHINRGIKLINY